METRFILDKKKANEATIYFQFSVDYKKVKVTTGETIELSKWKKGFPVKTNATKELRSKLSYFKTEIDNYIAEVIKEAKRTPTKQELTTFVKNLLNGKPQLTTTLKELVNIFIELQKCELNSSTIRYKKIHLNHFANLIGADKLTLNDLNDDLIQTYRGKLINEARENTTTNNYIKSVKSYLNWLYINDYTLRNYSDRLNKVKEIHKEVIALTSKELKIIEDAELPKHLQNQLDVFLFGCYTALSISDLKRVNKDMIADNGKTLVLRRAKTDKLLYIPLIPEAKALLQKHNYKLPTIADNNGNEALKIAFQMLRLTRKVMVTSKVGAKTVDEYKPLCSVISWHKARKTAITTAINKGLSIELVMQLSGHSKYDTMRKYIASSKELLALEMNTKMSKVKQMKAI